MEEVNEAVDTPMENSRSRDDNNDSWAASVESLCRVLEPEISRRDVKKAFGALKQKWQNDDETVDLKSMALWLDISEEKAKKIIEHYESQHFCTKFKLR
jgi:DnaJ-domain-containing protein 1